MWRCAGAKSRRSRPADRSSPESRAGASYSGCRSPWRDSRTRSEAARRTGRRTTPGRLSRCPGTLSRKPESLPPALPPQRARRRRSVVESAWHPSGPLLRSRFELAATLADPMGRPTDVPEQSRFSAVALILVVATITFLLAYDGGTFGETNRDSLAIGVWWVVILAAALGLWPLVRLSRAALLAGGLLALFAVFTLTSAIWADNAEDAFSEFERAALYVGIFALAALAARRATLARWSDGLALGIVATAGLSLFSRCFPDVILTEKTLRFLPLDFTRLSYPLEYWNGLAIFVALAVPLLLRTAVAPGRQLVRALALAPFPATGVVGAVALLVLAPHTRTMMALVVAGIGCAAGVASVATRDLLVNHPGLDAAGQGHVAFPLVLASCAATAVLCFLVLRFLAAR